MSGRIVHLCALFGFGSLCESALGGCPQAHQSVPALGQPRRSAQPDDALAAAPGTGGATSTENRHQLNLMPSGANPVFLLFCP
jgi:hypothetical protein